MTLTRRQVAALAAIAPALVPRIGRAQAQAFPARPVKLIAPWPVGGAIDALCRALGTRLADRLGQPVVTENRPGAGSTLGVTAGARSTPDGYTLVMAGSSSLAISPAMYKKLAFDPLKDLAPIALVARIPFVLVVNPAVPVRTVGELIQLAKAKPGQLNYGSGGPGSAHHLTAELFQAMTGIELTHVPYNGSAPALADVVAGHIQLLFSDPLPAPPQIKAGTVRALGVSSATRWPTEPDIPTIAEAGVAGFDAVPWGLLAAPAGTPQEIVARLAAETKAVAASTEWQTQIAGLGMLPVVSDPPDMLLDFIASERKRWGEVVARAGLAGTL